MYESTEIEDVVRATLAGLAEDGTDGGADPGRLDLDADLRDVHGLTSLLMTVLLTTVCDETKVPLTQFTEDDLAAIRTPNDMVAALRRHADRASTPWTRSAAVAMDDGAVRVRPLHPRDREPMRAIALDPEIWRYFVSRVQTSEEFDAFFDATLADHADGRRVVFVIEDSRTGAVAGSSSYGNIAQADGRLEIGWSWLGAEHRGAGVNRRAKFLLLRHAFEVLGAERVEFKTDALNLRARKGLLGIGAVEEGTLRSYNPMPGNRRRDAVFYGVVRADWPRVRSDLLTGMLS